MNVTIYRHAQSTANAGEATEEPASIPLTPLGEAQAEFLLRSRIFSGQPDLIVTSPYIRTSQTAAPIRRCFPDVPCEEWPIHEFKYLSEAEHRGTTKDERFEYAKAFWDREDPFHREDGAESLADLFERVRTMVDRMEGLDSSNVAVFGHGMFMRALMWSLITNNFGVTVETMRTFRSFCFSLPIPNTVAMPLIFDGYRWFVGSLNIGHLPTEMVTM